MASLQELVVLNQQGDLGKMLAEKFHGELGRRDNTTRGDWDFMIGFKSKAETPSIEAIKQAVVEHYTQLGYQVEAEKSSPPDMFCCMLFFESKGQGGITVTITTYYPLVYGDEHKHIRVTTYVLV